MLDFLLFSGYELWDVASGEWGKGEPEVIFEDFVRVYDFSMVEAGKDDETVFAIGVA